MNENLLEGEGYALSEHTIPHIQQYNRSVSGPASTGVRAMAEIDSALAWDSSGNASGILRRSSKRNALHANQPRSAVEAESKPTRSGPEQASNQSRSGVEDRSKSSRSALEQPSKKIRRFRVCSLLRRPLPLPWRGLAIGVFALLFMALCMPTLAQQVEISGQLRKLSIGDTLDADIPLPEILNHPAGKSTAGEYRGKWLLLDFWATYCPACINAMPYLWKIQEKFDEDLTILLVSPEKSDRIQRLLEKSPIAQGTAFPVVAEDTRLHRLFPHRIIPHEVWIDPDGVVRAITDHHQVTEQNVAGMLSGTLTQLPLKKDQTDWYQAQQYDAIAADQSILSQSTLRRYDPGVPTTGYFGRDTLGNEVTYRHVSFYNQPLLYMYYSVFMRCAVKRQGGNLNAYRIAVEIKDPRLQQQYANADLERPFYPSTFPYAGWETRRQYRDDNFFSYDLTLPDFVADTIFMQQVFADLGRQFPVRARPERRLVDAFVITVADSTLARKALTPVTGATAAGNELTKDAVVIENGTMDDFMTLLGYFRAPLMVDETNIDSSIAMQISFKGSPHWDPRRGLIANMYPFDMEVFRKQLNRYGLNITPQKRWMDMLVIYDELPNN